MELQNFVDYEKLFEHEIYNPQTREPMGIKVWMRSKDSAAGERLLLAYTDKQKDQLMKQNKLMAAKDDQQLEIERTAACIGRWDWGVNTWNGKPPEFTMETAVEVLTKQKWIEEQLREVARTIGNFITT